MLRGLPHGHMEGEVTWVVFGVSNETTRFWDSTAGRYAQCTMTDGALLHQSPITGSTKTKNNNTLDKSRRHDMYLSLLFNKACLK